MDPVIAEKIRQASEILNEKGIDLWLTFARETSATPDPVLDLLLGAHVTWQSAFLVSADGGARAIVGSLDAQNVRDHSPFDVTGYVDSIRPALMDAIKKLDPKHIAVNYSASDVMADGLTHGMWMTLTEYLKGSPYADRLVSSEAVIAALRGRKSEEEVRRIQGAIDEALDIFDAVSGFLRPGMTEKQVAEFILAEVDRRKLETAWESGQCPAVFTGPESAGAHADPTNRRIASGHILNIDFGVKKDGYCSDLQRTWYMLKPGETAPPPAVLRGFDTVRDAVKRAAEVLKPGMEGWTVDDAARSHIVSAGYPEYPHALGHQIGRQAHDGSSLLCPRWERYGNLPHSKTEAGQVYTLEPRLPVEGCGVATVEEIVIVTKDGCRFLSKPQEELLLVPDRK
jgi:Xaa-Pro aminopeptidase